MTIAVGAHLPEATFRITAEGGPYAGLDRYAARKQIVADLEAEGALERVEDYDIPILVSERSGGPQVYIMNADGAGARRMTFQGSYNTDPVWSPDGSRIAWVGRADFVVPVDSLGFEPEDTKLARIAKVNAVLQLCSYAEHLGKILDKDPEYIHVVTGSVEEGKEFSACKFFWRESWSDLRQV